MKRDSFILSWSLLSWLRLWIDFNLKDLSKLLQTSTWSFPRNESNIEILPWNWTFQLRHQRDIKACFMCLPCCQGGSAPALEAPQLSKLLRNKNYDSLRRILKYLRTKLPTWWKPWDPTNLCINDWRGAYFPYFSLNEGFNLRKADFNGKDEIGLTTLFLIEKFLKSCTFPLVRKGRKLKYECYKYVLCV